MLTSETAEVFDDDAVDPARVDVVHHPLECGSLEIRTGVTVVDILGAVSEAVFICIFLKDHALGLDGNTVAVGFVVTAETHIKCGIVWLFH